MIIVTYILLKRNTHLSFLGCNKGCKSHNLLIYTLVCGDRDSVYAECLSLLEQRGYIHNDIKVHNNIQVDNN